jgi:hypothetical protein
VSYRCFACPGPGASEIRPGRAAAGRPGDARPCFCANSTGRAAQLLPIALARHPDRSGQAVRFGNRLPGLPRRDAADRRGGLAGLAGLRPLLDLVAQ